MPDEERNKRRVVYIGQRFTANKKPGHCYMVLDNAGQLTNETFVVKTRMLGMPIGSVFTVTMTLTTVVTDGAEGPVYAYAWDNDSDLTDWHLKDRATRVQVAQERLLRRQAKDAHDPLVEALQPIRAHLRTLLPDQRAAAIAWIISYLNR